MSYSRVIHRVIHRFFGDENYVIRKKFTFSGLGRNHGVPFFGDGRCQTFRRVLCVLNTYLLGRAVGVYGGVGIQRTDALHNGAFAVGAAHAGDGEDVVVHGGMPVTKRWKSTACLAETMRPSICTATEGVGAATASESNVRCGDRRHDLCLLRSTC